MTTKSWSFSKYQQWSKCNYSITLKTPKGDVKHEKAQRGIDIHAAIEGFFLNLDATAIPSDLDIDPNARRTLEEIKINHNTWWPELKLGFTPDLKPIDYDAAWFRCQIDLVTYKPGIVEVWDWKTGKRDYNEIVHTQQLQLYMATAMVTFDECTLFQAHDLYLDSGIDHMTKAYTREQLKKILDRWKLNGDALTQDTEHRPNPGKHTCRFCNKASICEYYVPFK